MYYETTLSTIYKLLQKHESFAKFLQDIKTTNYQNSQTNSNHNSINNINSSNSNSNSNSTGSPSSSNVAVRETISVLPPRESLQNEGEDRLDLFDLLITPGM